MIQTRPIYTIAHEIQSNWKNVNYGAVPYLDDMFCIGSINENYGSDSAKSIIRYFLANAQTWRGEVARSIKAELNAMCK